VRFYASQYSLVLDELSNGQAVMPFSRQRLTV